MGALHEITFRKINGNQASIRIAAVHPDAVYAPGTEDFLLQALITYWNDLRLGYGFAFTGLSLSDAEMKAVAEKFPKRTDFEQWYTLMWGEEREISKEELDILMFRGYGHNPPKEAFDREKQVSEKIKERFGRDFGVSGSRKAGDDAPEICFVTLYPDKKKFVEVAKQIITRRTRGKSRQFKSFSKSTQSYGFQELTFEVSDAAYLSHVEEGSSVESANVVFSWS